MFAYRNITPSTRTARIAIVDDDASYAESTAAALGRLGYLVAWFTDAKQAAVELKNEMPDLAIFDFNMPDMNGLALMKALRKDADIPVIMVTGVADETDQLSALSEGVDDYLVKPVTMRMLHARIETILRRTHKPDLEEPDQQWPLIRGDLEMAPALHAARWKGEAVRLTAMEFSVLRALAERPGHVRSRGFLKTAAYGHANLVDDRTVDSHIKRLRSKLRKAGGGDDPIDTVYGLGYRFRGSSSGFI